MKNSLIGLVALVSLAACGGSSTAKISGKITNGNGKNLIFEKVENNAPVPVDTVKLDKDGNFEFELPQGKTDFYRLNLGDNNFVVLCLDSTNKAVLNADAKSLNETYTISGSKNSELIRDFFKKISPLNKDYREANEQLRGINFADSAKVSALRNQMQSSLDAIVKTTHDFIDNNPESAALLVAQSYLNPETELDYFKKIEAALAKSMPNSQYHNNITTQISRIEYMAQQMAQQKKVQDELIKNGSAVSDIKLESPAGKQLSLSSLKGKVVLVDFWASWCGPCRAENPNVVKLYDKYNKKGFEIFSVSLDKDKAAWTAAIAKDGLKWPNHVSDLKQWESSVVPQFGITGIPFTILVGKDGNVIGKGLRGAELEAKLEELFN